MFKLLLAGVLSVVTLSVNAQHRHYHHYHRHTNHYHWVAPVIIGGVIGYALANPQRVEAVPNTVYVEQPQISYSCPYGTVPVYRRQYAVDQWGRYIPYNQFLGCN